MHLVFHCSLSTVFFSTVKEEGLGLGQYNIFNINIESPFHAFEATSGEFEVEELLDHHVHGWGRSSEWDLKWRGYLLKQPIWEPRAYFANTSSILALYLEFRGLHSLSREGLSYL